MKYIAKQSEFNFESNDNINQNVKIHIPDRNELIFKLTDLQKKLASQHQFNKELLKVIEDKNKQISKFGKEQELVLSLLQKEGFNIISEDEYDEEDRELIEVIYDVIKVLHNNRGDYTI